MFSNHTNIIWSGCGKVATTVSTGGLSIGTGVASLLLEQQVKKTVSAIKRSVFLKIILLKFIIENQMSKYHAVQIIQKTVRAFNELGWFINRIQITSKRADVISGREAEPERYDTFYITKV